MKLGTKILYYLAGRPTPRTVQTRPIYNRMPSQKRSFYSGALDRITASFTGTALSVNESLKRDLDKMRHRSRKLTYDNDYAKKFIRMVKNNVVGSKGVRLQARAKGSNGLPDKMDNDAIEFWWKDFCKKEHCTVTGKLTMLDVQKVAAASAAGDGEVLIRIVKSARFKYGIKLQMIEADRLDSQMNTDPVAGSGQNKIVMGVELDEWDKPVAYYILAKHSSETAVMMLGKKYIRVPAEEIIHLYLPEYVAQARGIPWMNTSIRRLDMVGGYEEAELVAARAGAAKMGFYYTETGDDYQGDDVDANGSPIQEAEPGTFEQLPSGTKFEAYDPQHPTGAYNYFLRGTLRGAAAGLGVSYTGYTGDLEAVNYSSIRAGLIEERENWRDLQAWFAEHFLNEVYKVWLTWSLTKGVIVNSAGVKLPLSKLDKFMSVKWQARGWSWVDPLKDQQANDAAVAAGHMTNSEVVAARGNDLEEVYETLAWEKELAAKYGLDFGSQTSAEDMNDDDEEEQSTKETTKNN